MNLLKNLAIGLLRVALVLFMAAWSLFSLFSIFMLFDSTASVIPPWGWVVYPATCLWVLLILFVAGSIGKDTCA
jgi:hypothetical protein